MISLWYDTFIPGMVIYFPGLPSDNTLIVLTVLEKKRALLKHLECEVEVQSLLTRGEAQAQQVTHGSAKVVMHLTRHLSHSNCNLPVIHSGFL